MRAQSHLVIIVGAGPGGLSTALQLKTTGHQDIKILDRGEVGQSWLDYPPETRLLSESSKEKDENSIAGIPVGDVVPNISHPTHTMYQGYLKKVAIQSDLDISSGVDIISVSYDQNTQEFVLHTVAKDIYRAKYLIWATGMYSTPDEQMACSGCFIHYSRIQDWKHISEAEVTVVGGANGATEVVIQLAQPGRKIRLVTSKNYDVPEPIDSLWKENRKLVKDFEKEGLVEIVENFRVKRIYHEEVDFVIEGMEGQRLDSPTRPIVCIGFLPNTEPVKELVDTTLNGHDTLLGLDVSHQSKKTPGLFFAGTIGKLDPEHGFIRHFRDFGSAIAKQIPLS